MPLFSSQHNSRHGTDGCCGRLTRNARQTHTTTVAVYLPRTCPRTLLLLQSTPQTVDIPKYLHTHSTRALSHCEPRGSLPRPTWFVGQSASVGRNLSSQQPQQNHKEQVQNLTFRFTTQKPARHRWDAVQDRVYLPRAGARALLLFHPAHKYLPCKCTCTHRRHTHSQQFQAEGEAQGSLVVSQSALGAVTRSSQRRNRTGTARSIRPIIQSPMKSTDEMQWAGWTSDIRYARQPPRCIWRPVAASPHTACVSMHTVNS